MKIRELKMAVSIHPKVKRGWLIGFKPEAAKRPCVTWIPLLYGGRDSKQPAFTQPGPNHKKSSLSRLGVSLSCLCGSTATEGCICLLRSIANTSRFSIACDGKIVGSEDPAPRIPIRHTQVDPSVMSTYMHNQIDATLIEIYLWTIFS